MPIQFHCKHCMKRVQAPDAAAGSKAKCPACGAVIAVPSKKADDDPLAGFEEFLAGEASQSQVPRSASNQAKKPFDFKNASPADLKRQYDRLAEEIGDDRFFTKKELRYLPEVLSDGEQVLAFSSGIMDGNTWLIALTDRRVLFLDKGLVFGLKQTAIDLDKVHSVSGQTGLLFGRISIQAGASAKTITYVWNKTILKFTNKVRDAIEARKNAVPTSSGDDVVSKLEKLAALVEKGLITPDEFVRQKSKLLAT